MGKARNRRSADAGLRNLGRGCVCRWCERNGV